MAEKTIFLVIRYPMSDTAEAALAVLKQLSRDQVIRLKDAVAVTKTGEKRIKLSATKEDASDHGFLNGGLIGVILAVLFGPAYWTALGAEFGPAFWTLDGVIKDKLVEELGEKMILSESAVVLLVEHADWRKAVARMAEHSFQGSIVISQNVDEDLSPIEKLLEDPQTATSVPAELLLSALAGEALPEPATEPAALEPVVAEQEVAEEVVAEEGSPEVRRSKKVEDIEGVGDKYSQKLSDVGILTVEDLLDKGCSPNGRKEIAKATGISGQLILRWVNMADLYRIKGIGSEYAELLEAAGVDTVKELAQRVPANLLEKMQAANETKKLVRRLPVLSQVESWVVQAKSLPRIVTY